RVDMPGETISSSLFSTWATISPAALIFSISVLDFLMIIAALERLDRQPRSAPPALLQSASKRQQCGHQLLRLCLYRPLCRVAPSSNSSLEADASFRRRAPAASLWTLRGHRNG